MRNEDWLELLDAFVLHPEEVFLCRKLSDRTVANSDRSKHELGNLFPMHNFSKDGSHALYQKRN